MSIATYIESIDASRDTIRAKLVELGMVGSTAKLDACAAAIAELINRGAVSVEVKEGKTYTIPAGYHNGAGVVKAVSDAAGDAEAYKTQAKTATPTKNQQTITPDEGYYALESVVITAIPDNYQDVSGVTAGAADVLAGKIIVLADGTVKAGTMANHGAQNAILAAGTSYAIPAGYHNGLGKVTAKTLVEQTMADAVEEQILDGNTAWVNGVKVTGTMPNNGAVDASFDGLTVDSYTIPKGYHKGTGTVKLTDAIEKALAAI